VTDYLLAEQERIRSLLGQWNALFRRLKVAEVLAVTDTQRRLCLMRYHICLIWSSTAFSMSERDYDKHMDVFETMIEDFAKAKVSTKRSSTFCLETAFTPMLFAITMKCRALPTRLEALRLIKVHGVVRENLWNSRVMYAVGRRLIEIEHGVALDDLGELLPGAYPCDPSEERRVHHFVAEPSSNAQLRRDGREVQVTQVHFFMRSREDSTFIHSEIIASEGAFPVAHSNE
jgi:hypothetical protein